MQESRLFKIVYYLLDKGRATAPELAEYFEVSVRTIYRDIDALSGAGIPIYAETGRNGGIYLMKDFVLDMPYIINKQYSYAEGYVTEQSHGGADISSERRSVFLYDKVKDDEIEITVFSRYIDKNTYLKVQYLPHTKYGAIVEIK